MLNDRGDAEITAVKGAFINQVQGATSACHGGLIVRSRRKLKVSISGHWRAGRSAGRCITEQSKSLTAIEMALDLDQIAYTVGIDNSATTSAATPWLATLAMPTSPYDTQLDEPDPRTTR